ncbi:MAG: imidazole glycerol phosphate synthase subunit HisH [Proteobacteria bacterium]|nr:imidazole glycerol phosphate synthase subunit HisH [Pseudomonadota bacterium]
MSAKTIGILDYGAGNFGSVKRALEALSVTPEGVTQSHQLDSLSHLVFPGVGSAAQAMNALRSTGLDMALKDFVRSGRPILGICVGMQILGRYSAEGDTECLGLLPFEVHKFTCSEPVPHMGWNSLSWQKSHSAYSSAAKTLSDEANFYFVHSFAAFMKSDIAGSTHVLASCSYGGQEFAALVAERNVWGAQCHIEKSGRAGFAFLKNFLDTERL